MKLTLILLTLLVLPGCGNLDRSTDARPYFNASTAVDITTTRYDKDLGKRPESFFHGVPNLLPTYGDRCSPNSGVKRHSHDNRQRKNERNDQFKDLSRRRRDMVDPKDIEHVRESVTKIRQVRKIIADYKESLKEKSVEALQEEIEGKLDNILEQSEESVHADEWRELTSLRLELREKTQIVWSSKAKEEEYERLRNDFLKR